MKRVLGIETSCDETAAAVVAKTASGRGCILSNIIHSQIEEHVEFGGVVPEIAARAHLSLLDGIIERALAEANVLLGDLDAIAVTGGPGLAGGLLTGLMTAKALAAPTDLPLYAINHLEGHALTPGLSEDDPPAFPYLLLLVSGGHTQFIDVSEIGHYHRLATTIDDALGEAFDKTAKLLGLGYPGGPAVEKKAATGDPKRFAFPRPLSRSGEVNLSFSGLKTAVRHAAQEISPLAAKDIADICASFQAAIIDVLADRADKLIAFFEERHGGPSQLVIAGGVAANKAIRAALGKVCTRHSWRLVAPPVELCGDNAAMIAWAALQRIDKFPPDGLDIGPRTRWPLDESANALIGSGKRGAKV